MPTAIPLTNVTPGATLTSSLWNTYIVQNINKLLNQQHRQLTVAQFTALSAPEDGDEVYLEVDATNGVIWHLRYVSAETTYKWRYLGGPPMYSEVATAESPGSNGAYVALTTAGPAVALPRAGDYDVAVGAERGVATASGTRMSYDIGGTGAVDADAAAEGVTSGGTFPQNLTRTRRKTALATASLTAKYKIVTGTGTVTIAARWMTVHPVRIRHDA